MSGIIGVQSEAGTGSSFWIELPTAEQEVARWEEMERQVPAPRISTPGHPCTHIILYVEDNLSNLTLVQRILGKRPDIALIPCMQGGLALDLARLHRPDLVLLDLHLPDIPGEEVMKELRQTPDCRNIPVVVLSADATREQRDRLLAAGAHAYITKPLDVKPFIDVLDEVLSVGRAA
jgi:CheY-like chemotaxis protein